MGTSPRKQTGRGRATRASPPLPAGDESPESVAAESSRTPPREERRSRSRSNQRHRRSPTGPKQRGPFKIIPFEPREMRSDTYVHNFKHAIEAYYKGVQVSDYTKRNHFFEALSGQQRNAIGCQKIGGTYESMVKAFRRAYKVSRFNTVTEWTNIRRARTAGSPASGKRNPVSSRQTGLNKTVCLAQAKGRAYAVVEIAKGPKCRLPSCPSPSTSLSTSSYEGTA